MYDANILLCYNYNFFIMRKKLLTFLKSGLGLSLCLLMTSIGITLPIQSVSAEVTMNQQSGNLTGKVIDENGETIIGANVLVKGTTNGTITDIDGNFSLSLTNPQNAVLVISYIGYSSKEVPVRGQSKLDIQLDPSVINLGEVVAIGYGTQTRREITGSVASVSEDDFNKGVTRDAADLLQGKVAGLNIISGSGAVGDDPSILLRGVSTLQNDQGPMIVIDGVPGGSLSTVAPEDIESISVLKDASSAAIYGSRSAGGVILITTKRGSGSKTLISYNGYVALSTIAKKPDVLTGDEWRDYVRKSGQDGSIYDRYGADTNWFDEITRNGVAQNHSVSLSGGSSKSNYRASFNFLDREGVVKDDEMQRYNFRFQIQQRAINDRLRLGLTGSATMQDWNRADGRNFILAYNLLPVYPVKLEDGSWFDTREYDQGNPVRNQELNQNNYKSNNFNANGDISFTIISGLDIKANLYKSRNTREQSRYQHSETERGRDNNGFAERRNEINDKHLMEWFGTYNTAFGQNEEHKFDGMVGYSWEENEFTMMRVANRNFVTDLLGANSLQSGQGLRANDVESQKRSDRLISFFARAHYAYNERYMVTATVRRDGSSKFGENHKWGIFPSVSAAWGISQEDFVKEITWINDLKLRAGYGITGNQSGLAPYRSLELYGTDGTYYDNGSWLAAYKINQNANPDLKWEETSMLNIGVDFTLFKGRLGGSVEWYDKKTTDMLYDYRVPRPPYLHDRMMANVGDMRNTGIEALFNVGVIRSKDFSWTTSINLSHNKNEITKLSNDVYTTNRVYVGDAWVRGGSDNTTHVVEEGRPVGQFFGWKFLGFNDDGHFILEDTNGDGQISEDDRTYIGSAQPDLVFGLANSFNYKSWDFSFFLRGTVGNKILNHPRMAYANPGSLIGANALNDPLLYQLNEIPKYNSYYIENGSFMRLDNMSLGYTFNTRNTSWLERARVYVTAQNLFVLTGYKGMDPEVDQRRNDGLAPGVEDREYHPKTRNFSFGVNLTF
jgi:TonB-linked outer membrane protein, SusC/RagA family